MIGMYEKDRIQRLLSKVLRVPSPENSQPWQFVVNGNTIEVYHSRERARIGSSPDDLCVLGVGMVAEAISLAASSEGFSVRSTFMLEGRGDDAPWLRSELIDSGQEADPLADSLDLRHTDRRRYVGGDLSDSALIEVQSLAEGWKGANLYLVDHYPKEFLELSELADRLIFLSTDMRRDFMRWPRFSDAQIRNKRDGMPWRSFLRYPEQTYHYWQSRIWWLGARLDWFPGWLMELEERIFDDSGRPSPANYDDGAGIGCITTQTSSLEDLFSSGGLVLRAWLKLNQCGYGFQPINNLTAIAYPQRLGRWAEPSERIPELAKAFDVLQRTFGFSEKELPIFAFRTGKPPAPYPNNARTLRLQDRVRMLETQHGP